MRLLHLVLKITTIMWTLAMVVIIVMPTTQEMCMFVVFVLGKCASIRFKTDKYRNNKKRNTMKRVSKTRLFALLFLLFAGGCTETNVEEDGCGVYPECAG